MRLSLSQTIAVYRQKRAMIKYKLHEIINLAFHFRFLIDHNSLLGYLCAHFCGGGMSKKKTDLSQFEQTLSELEQIVQQLEQGELSLDQSLQQFERGITLARHSQQLLQSAEQKVQLLMQQQQQESLLPFEPEQEN